MKVPSYDDLTPSIPDVHPRDTFDQVTRLVPAEAPVVGASRPASTPDSRALFACIMGRNRAHGTAVMALAREFSPRIERHGDACVVLDVSGLGRLLGDAHGIARELARTAAVRGVKGTISIAPTQTAARLLALADAEPRVVTGDAAAAIAGIPFDTLQHLVVRPLAVFDIVRRWGIRSAGEFAALPAPDVASRFGQDGVAVQRLACGLDPHPLVPDPGVPRFVQMMELEWPLDALEPLSFVFARLLEPLASALERADRAAAALRLELRLVDKTAHLRMLQLPAPIRDPRVLRTLLLLDLESHPPSAAVDTVTIEVDPAPSRIVQYSLLERATPSPETLATLTARLAALTGEDRCGSPVLMDSFRPDAFVMTRFNPQDRRTLSAAAALDVPSAPLCLRRFRPPVAVRVAVERSRPVHVAIDRKGMPGGRVEQAAGPWRSSGSWWDATGEHWDRDEWDAALADGTVCRFYLDRVSGQWFMDAVVD
jgi:protein ImuB